MIDFVPLKFELNFSVNFDGLDDHNMLEVTDLQYLDAWSTIFARISSTCLQEVAKGKQDNLVTEDIEFLLKSSIAGLGRAINTTLDEARATPEQIKQVAITWAEMTGKLLDLAAPYWIAKAQQRQNP